VKKVIDRIRSSLQADGGNVELIGVKDGIVSAINRRLRMLPDVKHDIKNGD
jgi:hypothetical protein